MIPRAVSRKLPLLMGAMPSLHDAAGSILLTLAHAARTASRSGRIFRGHFGDAWPKQPDASGIGRELRIPPQFGEGAEKGKPFTFVQAALFQWVNPKAWVMAITSIAAYTMPSAYVANVFTVGLVYAVVNAPSMSCWTLFGTALRRFMSNPIHQMPGPNT